MATKSEIFITNLKSKDLNSKKVQPEVTKQREISKRRNLALRICKQNEILHYASRLRKKKDLSIESKPTLAEKQEQSKGKNQKPSDQKGRIQKQK